MLSLNGSGAFAGILVAAALSTGAACADAGPVSEACTLFSKARENWLRAARSGDAVFASLGVKYLMLSGSKTVAEGLFPNVDLTALLKQGELEFAKDRAIVEKYEARYRPGEVATFRVYPTKPNDSEVMQYKEAKRRISAWEKEVRELEIEIAGKRSARIYRIGIKGIGLALAVLPDVLWATNARAATLDEYYAVHPELMVARLETRQACETFKSRPSLAASFLKLRPALKAEENTTRISDGTLAAFETAWKIFSGGTLLESRKITTRLVSNPVSARVGMHGASTKPPLGLAVGAF